ncbi:MAG: CorA family divalent cation transporter [Anaerostipes sp.]|nr:CorA family divalent cation transporter [Anaerostipes sp.]
MSDRIVTYEQWKEMYQGKPHFHHLSREFEDISSCKVELFSKSVSGNLLIPNKKSNFEHSYKISFILSEDELILIDNTDFAKPLLDKAKRLMEEKDGVRELFQRFIIEIVSTDMSMLEEIEDDIGDVEEEILNGNLDKFNGRMPEYRRILRVIYIYYGQLSMLGETIQEYYFSDDRLTRMYDALEHRADRLQSRVQVLREYTKQVQEVYQAQVDSRQNEIMKVLTVVATIFMPLTLITGWYGMNFAAMPELTWHLGYPMIIVLSGLIVGFCVWVSKKKFM